METTAKDEMPLADALRRAQKEFGTHFPVWAFRRAVERGNVPSRRSSVVSHARYYVRWQVLVAYWKGLQT